MARNLVAILAVTACGGSAPPVHQPAAIVSPADVSPCTPARLVLRDTLDEEVRIGMTVGKKMPRLELLFRETLLQEIVRAYVPPERITVPILSGAVLEARETAELKDTSLKRDWDSNAFLQGEMRFDLHLDGRVSGLVMAIPSFSKELDKSLLEAIARLDSAHGFGPIPPGLGKDSMEFRIKVGGKASSVTTSLPLLSTRIPFARADKPALAREGNPAPRYPSAARDSGIEGDVYLSFIIDENGRAVMSTVRLTKPTQLVFFESVANVLPSHRFHPAQANGCAVKQLVWVPFQFRLTH